MTNKIFTFTGPSCSGKTTLVRELLSKYPDTFTEIVSFTSRSPRGGEKEGTDYHFLDPNECERLVNKGLTAEAINFKGNWYGITKGEISKRLAMGKTPIVIVEPNGLIQLRKNYDVFSIYVNAKIETLYTRFLSRFKETANPNIEYEAKRVSSIYLEHKEWYDKTLPVNLLVSEYNEHTQSAVMESILDTAKQQQK